jgi:hypothetical protein
MPYILPEDREKLLPSGHIRPNPKTAGELNYLITLLVQDFVSDNGGISYSRLNEVIGVLECAKLEAYRKLGNGYEDQKQILNGPAGQYY